MVKQLILKKHYNMELQNRTAIVCGCTQGIGYEIAKLFAANNCNLVLVSHDEEKLFNLQNALSSEFSVKTEYLVADFNDSYKVRDVIETYLINSRNKINILVNNTRGPMPAFLYVSRKELLREVFERHVISSHEITQVVINNMIEHNLSGKIINICDNTSLAPYPGLGLSSIRSAEIAWGLTLAKELAKFGITVNNILPGPTDTAGLKKIIKIIAQNEGKSYEDKLKEIINSLPFKRFAHPSEIANVALFLASDKSSYITGSNIKVDGGFNLTI